MFQNKSVSKLLLYERRMENRSSSRSLHSSKCLNLERWTTENNWKRKGHYDVCETFGTSPKLLVLFHFFQSGIGSTGAIASEKRMPKRKEKLKPNGFLLKKKKKKLLRGTKDITRERRRAHWRHDSVTLSFQAVKKIVIGRLFKWGFFFLHE